MTLTEFEEYAHEEFAKTLPAVLDDEDVDLTTTDDGLFPRLERKAIAEGVEVCERMAYFLVFALYDIHLDIHAEELGVPADYFEGHRPKEEEALAYLHERRLGAPPRHAGLPVN